MRNGVRALGRRGARLPLGPVHARVPQGRVDGLPARGGGEHGVGRTVPPVEAPVDRVCRAAHQRADQRVPDGVVQAGAAEPGTRVSGGSDVGPPVIESLGKS